jgi:hypothetical protein
MTAQELCQLPEPPEDDRLLGDLLVRGQRTYVGAHTGEGKTTFGLQMLRAVVLEEEFLGYQGHGGRALIVDAEQGLRTVKRRLTEAQLDDTMAVDVARAPDGLTLDSNRSDIDAMDAVLHAKPYSVVLLDPLYKLHRGDSNDERAAVDLMRQLDKWRDELGFALILTTHLRKEPANGAKLTMHEFFGSGAYGRGAEVVLGIRRVRPGYSHLYFIKDRDGDLPVGERWGMLFDRQNGFRRDPHEGKPSISERLAEMRHADPSMTHAQAAASLDASERTVRRHWKATEPTEELFQDEEHRQDDELPF